VTGATQNAIDGLLGGAAGDWAMVCGDNLAALRELPDDLFDGALLDPPYGLGNRAPTPDDILAFLGGDQLDHGGDFMGVNWSIPAVEFWRELCRVMKPGAAIGVYAGTQADDLLSIGARLGGFVREDAIDVFGTARFAWLQGQGMPHGLNVSRAIDEAAGVEREVVGTVSKADSYTNATGIFGGGPDHGGAMRITVSTTPHAARWSGYHTQLAPKHEVVLIFRKPARAVTSDELYAATGWDYWHVVTDVRTPETRARMVERYGAVVIPDRGETQSRRLRPLHAGVREAHELRWRPEHVVKRFIPRRVVDCMGCGESPLDDGAPLACPKCAGMFLTERVRVVVDETKWPGAWRVLARIELGEPYRAWSTDSTAATVLVRGVGAMNIDATRVYTDWNELDRGAAWKRGGHTAKPEARKIGGAPPGNGMSLHSAGRFTPNVVAIHDPACVCRGHRDVQAGRPRGESKAPSTKAAYGAYKKRSTVGTMSREEFEACGGAETVAYDCACLCLACGPDVAPAGGQAAPCPTCGASRLWLCAVAALDAQSGVRTSGELKKSYSRKKAHCYGEFGATQWRGEANSGGASRFVTVLEPDFHYAAKVAPSERNAGMPAGIDNPGLCLKPLSFGVHLATLLCPPGGLTLTTNAGTGSEVAAMVIAGCRVLGIERDAAQVEIAHRHIPGLIRMHARERGDPGQTTLPHE